MCRRFLLNDILMNLRLNRLVSTGRFCFFPNFVHHKNVIQMALKLFFKKASQFLFNLILLLLLAKLLGSTNITCTWRFIMWSAVLTLVCFVFHMVDWNIVAERTGRAFYFAQVKIEHKKALRKWKKDEVEGMVRPLKK